jgi:hypothetical protein
LRRASIFASHEINTRHQKDLAAKSTGLIFKAFFTIVAILFSECAVLRAEDAPEFTRQFLTNVDHIGWGIADIETGLPEDCCFESQSVSSVFCDDEDLQYQHELDEDWQLLPSGLMYRSYLAGEKEPRFQFVPMFNTKGGTVLETAMGGRVGLLRYGTHDSMVPEGWQLDMEGAVLARLDAEQELLPNVVFRENFSGDDFGMSCRGFGGCGFEFIS